MKEECPDELGALSNTELDDLNKNSALSIIQSDLQGALKISNISTDILDDLASRYEKRLSTAKTYKQLQIYFKSRIVAGESYLAYRMEDYRDLYDIVSRDFSNFEILTDSDVEISTITTSYSINIS